MTFKDFALPHDKKQSPENVSKLVRGGGQEGFQAHFFMKRNNMTDVKFCLIWGAASPLPHSPPPGL